VELRDLLDEYRIAYQTEGKHSTRNWLNINCPFCGQDGDKFHLGLHTVWHYAHCWRCGPRSLVSVLLALTGEPVDKCYLLAGGIARQRPTETRSGGRLVLPRGLGCLGKAHIRYLERRGFDPEGVGSLWGLKGLGIDAGRLAWRIWIPVQYRGQTVSWTTRAVSEKVKLRYIAAQPDEESLPAKALLYGGDAVRHTLLVVEGPLDVWAVGPGTVATLGVSYTRSQLKQMVSYPKRYVCFDAEAKAQEVALRLVRELSAFPGRTCNIVLDSGKDPSRANARELKQLRRLLK
jgi:hypothetical protein